MAKLSHDDTNEQRIQYLQGKFFEAVSRQARSRKMAREHFQDCCLNPNIYHGTGKPAGQTPSNTAQRWTVLAEVFQ